MCRFSDAGNDDLNHVLRRPAAEKRQGTKSRRWVVRRRCRGRYGDLAAGSGAQVMKRGGGRPILPRRVGVTGSVNEQRGFCTRRF